MIFASINSRKAAYLTPWLSYLFKKEDASEFRSGGYLTVHSIFIHSVFIIRSWNELQELIKNIDPHMTPTYKYGFYSSHTVCLPKFFPDPKVDASWAYSLFMILINFIAFFFIAIGYGLMCRWICEIFFQCRSSVIMLFSGIPQRQVQRSKVETL